MRSNAFTSTADTLSMRTSDQQQVQKEMKQMLKNEAACKNKHGWVIPVTTNETPQT